MSFTIGYCDTITFFTSGFFSAHVFANIIFFACQSIHRNVVRGFMQLLSLPVYLGALLLARQLFKFGSKGNDLLKAAGIILMATGLLSAILIAEDLLNGQTGSVLLAYLVVAAMGAMTASTYSLTSTFTLADSLVPSFWLKGRNPESHSVLAIPGSFFIGCVSGAVAGDFVGLSGVMLPGVLLFLFTMKD